MIHKDCERYSQVRTYLNTADGTKVGKWCSRRRCNTFMEFQTPLTEDRNDERNYRLPHDAVVVSMNDGEVVNSYCSTNCAFNDLLAIERQRKKK